MQIRSSRLFPVLISLFVFACGDAGNPGDADGLDAGGSGGAEFSGGSSSGGATNSGGSSLSGGASSGGSNSGGDTNLGGANASGGAETSGGSDSGGSSSGGSSESGGSSSGGSNSGGSTNSGGTSNSGGSSSGGSTSSGGSSNTGGTSGCDTPPTASALVGWAATSGRGTTTTTGGGSATPQVVTTLSQLQNAVKGTNAAVIHVKGELAPGKIEVGSNKTIIGLCGAEVHGALRLSGSVNVIVRNLTIVGFGEGNCSLDPDFDSGEGCSSGNDAVGITNNAHHVWFDHCEVRDGTDGNLDVNNGADYVTISWTRFTYTPRTDNVGDDSTGAAGHRFSNLVGGTDNPKNYDDANSLNVTWHHNHWDEGVVERMPRVRFGRNHLFNNLFTSSVANYCVRAGKGARVLLENNTFDGVRDAHEFNNSSDKTTAYISSSGNSYIGGTSGEQATGGGATPWTTPSYSYSLQTASASRTSILASVGPD